MSEQKKYDNSGILFNNDKKTVGSNQADRQGSATINGVDYWVSGWVKEGNKGRFLTLSFKLKEDKQDAPAKNNRDAFKAAAATDFESDIPFAHHGKAGAGVSWRAM